jgi:hypothetical protein
LDHVVPQRTRLDVGDPRDGIDHYLTVVEVELQEERALERRERLTQMTGGLRGDGEPVGPRVGKGGLDVFYARRPAHARRTQVNAEVEWPDRRGVLI